MLIITNIEATTKWQCSITIYIIFWFKLVWDLKPAIIIIIIIIIIAKTSKAPLTGAQLRRTVHAYTYKLKALASGTPGSN